jgi:hypothetical protein
MGVLAAAMRKIRAEQPGNGGADPIFAVIAEHREATAWHVATAGAYVGMRPGDPGHDEAQEADAIACSRWSDSVYALFTCQPTTLGGLLALLDHMGQPENLGLRESERTVLADAHQNNAADADEDPAVLDFPSMVAATLRKLMPPQDVGESAGR